MKLTKKILTVFIAGLITSPSQAGLITHTDYTSGGTITAALQNTNENTIYSEFNGNIESNNIKDGTIVTGDISASAGITASQLSSVLQSSITYLNTTGSYRRPVLQWISATLVDVERNTGTANQTCINFNNEQRCVTEDTSSTNKYRRFDITAAANFVSGTEDSGLIGTTEAVNTWYAIYAVKSQISASNFVLVGTTVTPPSVASNIPTTGGNYTTLNSMFGVNGWVYLGLVANGDNAGATGDIKNFTQTGNLTLLDQAATTANVTIGTGIRLATTTGAASLTWSFNRSTSTIAVPATAGNFIYQIGSAITNTGASGDIITDTGGTIPYGSITGNATGQSYSRIIVGSTSGVKVTHGTGTAAIDIMFVGYYDSVLGVGSNPQL